MATNNHPKQILITGASGFIGGFLVDEALRRGYQVWAGIRPSSDRSHLQDPRIRFIDLPYSDAAKLSDVIANHVREEGPWDFIIHNAGLTKTTDKRLFFEVNAENTRRFLDALAPATHRPKKFLLMSSLSSFGIGDEHGFAPFRLDDTQRPNTAYGKANFLPSSMSAGRRTSLILFSVPREFMALGNGIIMWKSRLFNRVGI